MNSSHTPALIQILPILSFMNSQNDSFVWICSLDYSKQFYVSNTFADIWQRPSDILFDGERVDNWASTIIDDDVHRLKPIFYEQLQLENTLNPLRIYYRIELPNNKTRYITDYSFKLYNQQQQPVAMFGIGRMLSKTDWSEQFKILSNLNNTVLPTNFHNHKLDEVLLTLLKPQATPMHKYQLNTGTELIKLSKREAECLAKLLEGCNVKKIARFYDISPRTVETYLQQIRSKANCSSVLELICKTKNAEEILNLCDVK